MTLPPVYKKIITQYDEGNQPIVLSHEDYIEYLTFLCPYPMSYKGVEVTFIDS